MKKEYDFRKGKCGAIEPTAPGKARITIRLDEEIIKWFRDQVTRQGGGNYQTLINEALQDYIHQKKEPLEQTVRRVIREELERVG